MDLYYFDNILFTIQALPPLFPLNTYISISLNLFTICALILLALIKNTHASWTKKIYQSMTPAQKLDVSIKLYQSAKTLKKAAIKKQLPEWSEEKIKKLVNEIFLYAGTWTLSNTLSSLSEHGIYQLSHRDQIQSTLTSNSQIRLLFTNQGTIPYL